MTCFKLPVSLCKRIQSVLTRFWWDDKPEKHKMSLISWDKLAPPKSAGGLGFRDIETFNDTLLAKISWRVLKNQDTLMARVLLGKYCHSVNFMDAVPPTNASHGWRGIIAGRQVLARGLGWVIGSGESVSVWSDSWLSPTAPTTPIGPPPRSMRYLKVSQLIHEEVNQWNIQAIRHFLPQYEDQILQIQLSSTRHQDSQVWLFTKNGEYSTKTGYAVSILEDHPDVHPCFNWYKHVWKVRTMPKIQTFLWKAIRGALPVNMALTTRGIIPNSNCIRCGLPETIDHVLLQCSFAQQVWSKVPIMGLTPLHLSSMLHLCSKASELRSLPPSGLNNVALYAWICWSLWTARNSLIFSNVSFSPDETLVKAIVDARVWMVTQDELPKRRPPRQLELITPTSDSGVSCHVDAAWLSSSRRCGLGCVFRDETAEFMFEATGTKSHVCSALAAEAHAIILALSKARDRDIRELHIFSDSQVLIRLLVQQESHVEIANLLLDIRLLTAAFLNISFHFVSRILNSTADALAKSALSSCSPLAILP